MLSLACTQNCMTSNVFVYAWQCIRHVVTDGYRL